MLTIALFLAAPAWGVVPTPTFPEVIHRVVAMPSDSDLQSRAGALGFNILNVMWEDTGRSEGSALGPNISDLTLQVREPGGATHLLPVIRYPNFTDKTGDIRADKLWVRVGNQKKGGELQALPLAEVLKHLRRHLSVPTSLVGNDDFTASRDSHYLVSAQHVFVPIPAGGKAEFNPYIFNYQSGPGSPAVMTLLITREGMSATILEGPQPLFFNQAGERTVFTAERKSDVKQRIEAGEAKPADATALEEGADMMMIVQVPLKHQNVGYLPGLGSAVAMSAPSAAGAGDSMKVAQEERAKDDVEQAVLGHGDAMGPFAEMHNMRLERDSRFPVRVTVQFYRATSNGVISQQSLVDVKKSIDRVYADADYVGSLVVPDGSRERPTSWLQRLRMSLRIGSGK